MNLTPHLIDTARRAFAVVVLALLCASTRTTTAVLAG